MRGIEYSKEPEWLFLFKSVLLSFLISWAFLHKLQVIYLLCSRQIAETLFAVFSFELMYTLCFFFLNTVQVLVLKGVCHILVWKYDPKLLSVKRFPVLAVVQSQCCQTDHLLHVYVWWHVGLLFLKVWWKIIFLKVWWKIK